MIIRDVINVLQKLAPFESAEKWDNPGLLVGNLNSEVKKILLAVDASDYVINTAVSQNVDLIITHHPLIFTGLKRVTDSDFIGRRILRLVENKISLIAMHTNFDMYMMTDAVCEQLGLNKSGILEPITTINSQDENGETISEEIGFGCYGTLEDVDTVGNVAELVKDRFSLEKVRVFGALKKEAKSVGIFQGSGRSAIDIAVAKGIDVLITGDIDHHSGIDAVAKGMCIIDAGHYGIEKIFVDYMNSYLEQNMPAIDRVCIRDDEPFVTI